MELRPILSTLSRHKTAAALIILEIALSCAIISVSYTHLTLPTKRIV